MAETTSSWNEEVDVSVRLTQFARLIAREAARGFVSEELDL